MDSNECFALNICPLDPSSVSKLVLLTKVMLKFLVSITLILLVQLSNLLLSCVVLSLAECNFLGILIFTFPLSVPGFNVSAHFFSHLVFLAIKSTRHFLSFIINLTLFIYFFMLMTLLLPATTYLFLTALLASFILSLLPRILAL